MFYAKLKNYTASVRAKLIHSLFLLAALFAKALSGIEVKDLITKIGSSAGSAGPAAAGGGGGAAPAAEEAKKGEWCRLVSLVLMFLVEFELNIDRPFEMRN